ncbi:uncharacterized protein LOC135090585 [Scylla paramamosain]|uniref:uncharacterized protein LOC135090585 n=1 Tax=Scylla paramamosain TaxID=85552 RepID=UPI003083256C
MLSPDVPEFVPRGCQTPDSTNMVNIEPKENTSHAQLTKSSAGTHKPSSAGPNPSVPKSSPLRGERGVASGSRAPNDSWRRPKEVFGDQRDSQTQDLTRHESGIEMNQGERHTPQRGKGKPRPVAENLELHIRNKFTTPKPSYSYTKILKSKQPVNSASVPEAKSVKQDFSFSNDSHWPTLGESLPLYKTPEKNSKPSETEKRDSNPWVKKSNESSPTKFFTKNPWQDRGMAEQTADAFMRPKTTETSSPLKSQRKNPKTWQERSTSEHNGDAPVRPKSTDSSTKRSRNIPGHAWQERSTSEQSASDSVRSRIADGNSKTPENCVKTKPSSHTQRKKVETDSHDDNSAPESKESNLPKDKINEYDRELRSQKSYAKTAMNTEFKETHGIQNQEEATQATKQNSTHNDSDLFQWQVIGEKKNKVKKPRIKPEEELEGSPQFPKLVRGDGNKHGRVLPDKPSQNDRTKENQENISKKKYVVDLSKTKGANSTSTQEISEGAVRKDTKALRPSQKEKKKPRPTRVTSLANCSSDKKEIRTNPKAATTSTSTTTATASAAAKPLSEEALQKKLAFKLMKKEEKIKKREMKCLQARMASRDTKVSVISSVFLEKTQATSKASTRPSSQINLTLEEYPSLQMQRKVTKRDIPQAHTSLPSHTDTHRDSPSSLPPRTSDPQASPSLQTTTDVSQSSENKPTARVTTSSQKVRLKGDDLLSGLLPVNASDDDNDDGLEESAVTYRKALLSAKAKKVTKQDTRHSEPSANTRVDAAPPKKQIRTKDPLMLNLQALAAKCRKNKKREAAYLEEKYSPTKRKDDREDEFPSRKPGTAALPKVAGVVAKRGKINAKKPKKKKISRVMKCKIEKRQRETLALQLLLAQANARQQEQQQEVLEPLSTTNNENENSTVIKDAVADCDTNEPPCTTTENETRLENKTQESVEAKSMEGDDATNSLNSATKTETDKEEGERRPGKDKDKEKQESDQEKSDGRNEDYDENKENKNSNKTSPNIKPQVMKAPEGDDKSKIIWKIRGIQEPIMEDSTPAPDKTSNSEMKDANTEGKSGSQQSTDEPKSSHSPAQLKLLADDPLVVKKASELIEMLKAQSKPSGPREYCHQVVTPEVNAVAKELISTLMAFQKRHYQRDPTKARIRKRYVCGLKETTKLMGKMSCVIMAPNIQQCEGPGSLDDAVEKLLNQAEKLKVPVVFALSTKEMKYLCRKSSRKVSCFGIINYQGAQDIFQRLMQLMPEAQKQYQELVASGQCSLPKEGEDEDEEEEEGEPLKKDLTAEVVNRTKSLLMAP